MRKTIILTALLLSGIVMTFNACKKGSEQPAIEQQENGTPKVENGRLAFKSNDDYYNYIESVNSTTTAKTGFRSLREALNASYKHKDSDPGLSPTLADLDKFGFPAGYLATLNEKGEVKIGDQVIWYHDGKKYYIPASEEANLETIKQSPAQIQNAHPYITIKLANENARADLGNTGLDARNQWPFTPLSEINGQPLVGSQRKYVHEIYAKYDYSGNEGGVNIYRASVILRLKMEWRGCCDWNANASEERSENVAVSGTAALPGMSRWSSYISGPTFNVTLDRPSTRENIDITLVTAEVVGTVPPTWNVDMTGTITSNFIGSTPASGRWVNSGNLW
jgi:hypothetical protein